MFGGEEAIRLHDKIMSFQWFDTVTWDNFKDLRVHHLRPAANAILVCSLTASARLPSF